MSTLTEIEKAADSLSTEEKEALLRFLAIKLRQERLTAPPTQTNLAGFAGSLRLTEDPLNWQRRARAEWE